MASVTASLSEQQMLLEVQAHDSASDRLVHRRGHLPEHAKLAELATALAAIDQLHAEREGARETLRREQERLEHEVEALTAKRAREEERALSGRVTSPKELTAIQEEVAALKRRVATLEDDLLERMERRETLDGELAELAERRQRARAEQEEVTARRDALVAEIEAGLAAEREQRDRLAPQLGEVLRALYEQLRARHGGVGAAVLDGKTCQGCRVSLSAVELANLRKLPADEVKRCENCRRILVMG